MAFQATIAPITRRRTPDEIGGRAEVKETTYVLITDQLIFLNFSKTGTTFVHSVFERLQEQRSARPRARIAKLLGLSSRPLFEDYRPPRTYGIYSSDGDLVPTIRDQHAGYRYIPTDLRSRTVISIARNPFDRLVSTYEYRWWAKFPPLHPNEISARFPDFPDLSFSQYVEFDQFVMAKRITNPPSISIGWNVFEFLDMYIMTECNIFDLITDMYIMQCSYLNNLCPVRFLRQETLRDSLHELLIEFGYPTADISFIRQAEHIQPREGTRRREYDWRTYYSTELMERVRAAYDITFRCYAARGIGYG